MDRYEEALERAKAGKPMDEVFPELKESEDERIRKALIEVAREVAQEQFFINRGTTLKNVLAYLEKQKEQQPAEWSEEDERICKGLKELIPQCMTAHGYNRYYNWLKNLHNRIHAQANWKPSEEQMEALRIAYEIGTANESWAMSVLKSLYEQLEKL